MLHFLWAPSLKFEGRYWGIEVRRREMMILTVSVWSEGGRKVVPWISNETSRHRRQQWDNDTVLLTSAFPLVFPFLAFFGHCLLFVHLSSQLLLFSSARLWSVFFSCTVLRLILLFTVLFYCPQLNKGNMSLYWQLILCVRVRLRHFSQHRIL